MSQVGQLESETQNRVVKLFQKVLDYRYLGNWEEREDLGNAPWYIDYLFYNSFNLFSFTIFSPRVADWFTVGWDISKRFDNCTILILSPVRLILSINSVKFLTMLWKLPSWHSYNQYNSLLLQIYCWGGMLACSLLKYNVIFNKGHAPVWRMEK